MPRTGRSLVLSFALIFTMAISSFVIAAEKKSEKGNEEAKLTKGDLPAAVMTAFQKSYPKATIKGLSKEMEDSTQMYEVESLDGKTVRSILYKGDGSVYEIEEGIQVSSLPSVVKNSIMTAQPNCKIKRAEKITHGDVTQYEVKVVSGKEKSELVLDPTGKIVKTEKQSAKKGEGDED
jgi:hypothetical protein